MEKKEDMAFSIEYIKLVNDPDNESVGEGFLPGEEHPYDVAKQESAKRILNTLAA